MPAHARSSRRGVPRSRRRHRAPSHVPFAAAALAFGVGTVAAVVVAAYPSDPRASADAHSVGEVAPASESQVAVTTPDITASAASMPPTVAASRSSSPRTSAPRRHRPQRTVPTPARTQSSPRHGSGTGGAPSGSPKGGGPVNGAPIGYSPSAHSAADIAAAMKQAKTDGLYVLLDFGATWCGNCRALDQVYADPSVKKLLGEHYHLVQIDIGENDNTTNMGILSHYDSSGSYGLPVLIVVTPDGTVHADTNKTGLPQLSVSGFTAWLDRWI